MILEIPDSSTPSPPPPSSLWDKALTVWQSVGHDMISQKSPSTDAMADFISRDQSMTEIDQFFSTIPNQTFLLAYLEIFPLLVKQLSISPAQLTAATGIFRSVLSTPVSKDVSPFLVPSANDSAMSSVQRQVINCLLILITRDEVFQTNNGNNKAPHQKTSLLNRSEISNLSQTLTLCTKSFPLFEDIFKELLLYSSYGWTPVGVQKVVQRSSRLPLVVVNMVPFGLSCLVLSVQLFKSYLSHDSRVTSSFLSKFLEVSTYSVVTNMV